MRKLKFVHNIDINNNYNGNNNRKNNTAVHGFVVNQLRLISKVIICVEFKSENGVVVCKESKQLFRPSQYCDLCGFCIH